MRFLNKYIIVFIVLLFLCSSIVLADPPHKDHPGKDKKKPSVIDPTNNISIVWISNGFSSSLYLYSNEEDIWSEWSPWWSIWNTISDTPIINDGHSINIKCKFKIGSEG